MEHNLDEKLGHVLDFLTEKVVFFKIISHRYHKKPHLEDVFIISGHQLGSHHGNSSARLHLHRLQCVGQLGGVVIVTKHTHL